MVQVRPKLITFGISRFCEKARWALDWHGIDYEEIGWPPGLHMVLAKRYGAKASSLPLLLDGKKVIQGSGAIIDWTDQKARDRNRRLGLTGALEIEQRADKVLGVHIRRLSLAEMLPQFSHRVKPAFLLNASASHWLIGNITWPVSRQIMIRAMDLGPGAAADSRSKLEAELAWLDGMLAEGRPYLAGDRFSRADITVASFLGPLARPQEAIYGSMQLSDALLADSERWRDRPVMRWVAAQYQTNRKH